MLLDLLTDWVNSEIPAISNKADAAAIADRDRRVAKAQIMRQAVIEFQSAHDQVVKDDAAKYRDLTAKYDQAVKDAKGSIAQRDEQIAALTIQVATLETLLAESAPNANWQSIIDQLDEAGFDEHLEAAVAAGVGAFGAASRIIAAVQVGDLTTIDKYWQAIAKKYPPEKDQLAKWDSILSESKVENFSFEPR